MASQIVLENFQLYFVWIAEIKVYQYANLLTAEVCSSLSGALPIQSIYASREFFPSIPATLSGVNTRFRQPCLPFSYPSYLFLSVTVTTQIHFYYMLSTFLRQLIFHAHIWHCFSFIALNFYWETTCETKQTITANSYYMRLCSCEDFLRCYIITLIVVR